MDVKAQIRQWTAQEGALRCGFAEAAPVDEGAKQQYAAWIANGQHGGMQYCEAYTEVRDDPRLLLEGARTLISCAFPYYSGQKSPIISQYALGQDYHHVVKARLLKVAERIKENFGGECRAMVDTAPLRERYWAVKAGLGFIGLNNQLIVPDEGSYVFLGELLWTGEVEPDAPCTLSCIGCKRCAIYCPGKALDGKGDCNASKCLSYLSIEHRGDLPDGVKLGNRIYGCDVCQQICPHNRYIEPKALPEFTPNPEILELTPEALLSMTPSHYKKLISRSAMRRAPLAQLIRNIKNT